MFIQTFILFLAFLSCQEPTARPKVLAKPIITKAVKMKRSSCFIGNYSGKQNQKEIFISLSAVTNTNKIIGILIMDGKQAKITTTETNAICTGTITEDDTRKKYNIVLKIIDNKLHFDMVLPEYNNQVLALVLERSTLTLNSGNGNIIIDSESGNVITSGSNSGSSTKLLNRDRTLFGKWRFTEVISSGSGQFYSSFSTDYFMQLLENGSCITWTGKSAGGTNNVSFDSNEGKNKEEAQWYTNGKSIIFINPNTKKQVSIPYYAEQNRMMLKGKVNRVYQRVN